MKQMNLDKQIWKYIIGIACIVVCIMYLDKVGSLLSFIWNAVKVLVYGGMIAYVLNLIMTRIERLIERLKQPILYKIKRPLALLLSLLIIGTIIYLLLAIVIPALAEASQVLLRVLPGYFNDLQKLLIDLFENNPQIVKILENMEIDWKKLLDQAFAFLGTGISSVVGSTFSIMNVVIGILFDALLSIILAIYILLDKERFIRLYYRLSKLYLKQNQRDKLTHALRVIHQSFSAFIGGQCIEATILGGLCATGMYILHMPYPLMIGVLVGLINIIPMIGAYIGGAIGMFMVFTVNPMLSLGFLVYLCILQQFESNVIYPRVVGNSVGLPGIYVMITVVVFGSLAGIVGMLLGIPLMASIYKLTKLHVENKEKQLEEHATV